MSSENNASGVNGAHTHASAPSGASPQGADALASGGVVSDDQWVVCALDNLDWLSRTRSYGRAAKMAHLITSILLHGTSASLPQRRAQCQARRPELLDAAATHRPTPKKATTKALEAIAKAKLSHRRNALTSTTVGVIADAVASTVTARCT